MARQADSHESLEFLIRANHATKIREVPPGLLQHVLIVLVFWSWVLPLPLLPPWSRAIRLFPCASILLFGPLDIAWICCPQLPHHPCKNGTHSTCFYSTGGHTPIEGAPSVALNSLCGWPLLLHFFLEKEPPHKEFQGGVRNGGCSVLHPLPSKTGLKPQHARSRPLSTAIWQSFFRLGLRKFKALAMWDVDHLLCQPTPPYFKGADSPWKFKGWGVSKPLCFTHCC